LILQLQTWHWDYCNWIKVKAKQVVLEHFKKLHGNNMDAIQDREKWVEFGTKWCNATTNDYSAGQPNSTNLLVLEI